ncbi:ZIP family metal transporter [Candidatus Sumerlaeota bacterium]|nr:ZIP family metal transporter [Candidatus Sumerlaeota bacterium]
MSAFFASIVEAFTGANPIVQALLATLFTYGMTAAGAIPVLFTSRLDPDKFNFFLGFAAGVMIAASFWSLLAPAIEMSGGAFFPATVGFLLGGAFLLGIDKILPHLHLGLPKDEAEGIHTSWHRSTLLILAITLHNFPEGLAVGVAIGAAAAGLPEATLAGGMVLALGIGIQNLPEGLAVAMPLRREGMSRGRCLWYGQLSGIVEPVAGVLGAATVVVCRPILPYALAFAAGAMIFVVAEELIPESQRKGGTDLPTIGVMTGFAIMMALDVALG